MGKGNRYLTLDCDAARMELALSQQVYCSQLSDSAPFYRSKNQFNMIDRNSAYPS
jgi:hypothetical protein